MSTMHFRFDDWDISCIPGDGGRIASLKYKGVELFTSLKEYKGLPSGDFGEYELRPVYGYDDCFPSVVSCIHPTDGYVVRDHGQLCWLPWDMQRNDDSLLASVQCDLPASRFVRQMKFADNQITWTFKLENNSGTPLHFLHVAHPLFDIRKVNQIILPAFESSLGLHGSAMNDCRTPLEINKHFLQLPKGNFDLVSVINLQEGMAGLGFNNGMQLHVHFDLQIFPNLAIWWNKNGYPQEAGLARYECALEPIPGQNSDLTDSYAAGTCLKLEEHGEMTWNMVWTIHESIPA